MQRSVDCDVALEQTAVDIDFEDKSLNTQVVFRPGDSEAGACAYAALLDGASPSVCTSKSSTLGRKEGVGPGWGPNEIQFIASVSRCSASAVPTGKEEFAWKSWAKTQEKMSRSKSPLRGVRIEDEPLEACDFYIGRGCYQKKPWAISFLQPIQAGPLYGQESSGRKIQACVERR